MDVVRDVYIPWDPDNEDITIHSDSVAGSDDVVLVWFYNDNDLNAGGVRIEFASPIR